jgi:hypothetical protein
MRISAGASRVAPSIGLLLPIASSVVAQEPDPIWVDRPLTSWNKAGDPLPKPPSLEESRLAVISRCHLTPSVSTAAERAVDAAGWIPFLNFDQQLVQGDVEIVGGMRGADGMCRPEAYNLFVFVGGRFAGLLSPTPMTVTTRRFVGSSQAAAAGYFRRVRSVCQQRSALLPLVSRNCFVSDRSHRRSGGRRPRRSKDYSTLNHDRALTRRPPG